jgi:hypothetical protein
MADPVQVVGMLTINGSEKDPDFLKPTGGKVLKV